MGFLGKIQRKTPLPYHQRQLADELVESCTIGLKLSPDFNPKHAKRLNARYTNRPIGVKHFRNSVAVDYEVDLEHMQQNFVITQPLENIRVFLHGRELFTPEMASKYFADGFDKDSVTIDMFSNNVAAKIRAAMLPGSLAARLPKTAYLTKDETTELARYQLAEAKKRFPHLDYSSLPPLSHETAEKLRVELGELLATHVTEDYSDVITNHPLLITSCDTIEQHVANYSVKAETFFKDALEDLASDEERERAISYKQQLFDFMAKHDWDPEILNNFMKGIPLVKEANAYVPSIIFEGLNTRVEKAEQKLLGEIKAMSNPYDPRFSMAERDVAKAIVSAVHPRVLAKARERSMHVLVTDAASTKEEGIDVFKEMSISNDGLNAGGYYQKSMFIEGAQSGDVIILSAAGMNFPTLAEYARHEFEHMVDFLGPKFHTLPESKLDAAMKKDRYTLDSWHNLIREITPHSPPKDIYKVYSLASMLAMKQPKTPSKQSLRETQRELLKVMAHVQEWAKNFMPKPGDTINDFYTTRENQLDEAMPVIAQLKSVYGNEFVKTLMPETYKLTTMHHYNLLHRGQNEEYSQAI